MLFEGEYLNGERWNGKGIEFDVFYGYLLFAGEYFNGNKWNGIGNEYKNFKVISFKYLNGKKIFN